MFISSYLHEECACPGKMFNIINFLFVWTAWFYSGALNLLLIFTFDILLDYDFLNSQPGILFFYQEH